MVSAKKRLKTGKTHEALALCQDEINAGNNDPQLLVALFMVYQELGDRSKVLDTIQSLLSIDSDNRVYWTYLSNELVNTTDYQKSLDWLESIHTAKNDVYVNICAAYIYKSAGKHRKVIKTLESIYNNALSEANVENETNAVIVAQLISDAFIEIGDRKSASVIYQK